MKLKKLILQGYKTFASRTEFVFDEGITAIVGPNGSGKSNIADAVRWVLGEQSYSTLRGKRTEDMIFAGSEQRARSGMAQATLTLDNSDGWLPIDYTEVEIGRRAYRSGENEYILNGQKVRLKDILDLLATSGLAERTYTIIGQGLIDQALSLRAEERRALFEEAAGIMHYKKKRATTLRQLQETQRNLERVHDILAEIKPRLSALKGQATRARNYEQIRADLRHLLRIWYGYRWEEAKERLRLARQTADSAEESWQESREQLLAHQDNINDLRQRINRRQRRIQEMEERRDELRGQLEKARRDLAILEERRESIQRQLREIEEERPSLSGQRAAAAADLEEATAVLDKAQSELQANQADLRQFNANFQSQQATINRWRERRQKAESDLRRAQNQLAGAEGQLSQLQEQQDALAAPAEDGEERTHITAEIAQIEAEIEKHRRAAESAQEQVDELEAKQETIRRQRRGRIDELKNMRRALADAEKALNRQQKEAARLETRVDMLDQMRRKEVETGDGVEAQGQLTAFLTIPDEYQTAVSAALGARLATLILSNGEQLWRLLAEQSDQALNAAALADVTPPEPLDAPQETAVIGWASDKIDHQETATPLAQLLLGRVLLVNDRKTAYRLAQTLPPGALTVTLDGFVAYAGGLVAVNGAEAQQALLAREQEWREAQAAWAKLQEEVEAAEKGAAKKRRQIDEKQAAVDARRQEEEQLSRLVQETVQRVNQAQQREERAKQQRRFLQRQEAELDKRAAARRQERERLAERIEKTKARIEELREKIVAGETAVAEARTQLEQLPIAEAKQQRQTLNQAINSAQTIVAGRQAVVDSRRAALNQVDKQITRLEEREAALRRQRDKLAIGEEEKTCQRLQNKLDELEAHLQPVRAQLATNRRDLRRLEDDMATIQRRTLELETQYTQAQVRLSQRENQIEGLQERIKADLGIVALSYDEDQTGPTPLPISNVVDQLPTVGKLPEDIEENIHNYRGQLQRMGGINPDAPQEYEQTQERFDFLTQQVEDLNQTEAQLRDVIEELDDLTSRAFAQTVEDVNDVFGDTFHQLFEGGSARLTLTDPDDLTVSGVDIIAKLPNRREQGLGLLSGGERSLTAAALIFSLLKVSPTPFCVMDEVDAALDEANVNRFRELLRELSLKIQFVVITHNRGTVQAAHTIYGISMNADSTSQSISIKPDEYLKQEELF